MINLALENLIVKPNRISNLNDEAGREIKIRGYNSQYSIPPDLNKKEWFLPVNLIVGDYCPTERYIFLKKHKRTIKLESTWESLQGKIIDYIYGIMIEQIQEYLSHTKIDKLSLVSNFKIFQVNILKNVGAIIRKEKKKLMNNPSEGKILQFLSEINKLLIYEHQLAMSIVNYLISIKGMQINLKAESMLVFPFITKPKIQTTNFGFTSGAEPDFIFDNQIIGDVKTGEWKNSFYYTLAAYALAYENEKRKPINLGIIINPSFSKKRTVPIYTNFEVVALKDPLRKAVIALRDRRIEIIKNKTDKGIPKDRDLCRTCGYYNHCWGAKTV